MADRRMLWKVVSMSRKVNQLSCRAALLWTWTIPFLDPEGYIEAEADYLKDAIVPKRKDIREKDIPQLVNEIVGVGLWQPLAFDGKLIIREIKFFEYQKIRREEDGNPKYEAPSRFEGKVTEIDIGSELYQRYIGGTP